MAVNIQISKSAVVARVVEAWDRGLPLLSEEILNDCNTYCKEDNHALIDSSNEHSDLPAGKLVWQTPYARRQYWEIKTAYKDKNPNASWKWCEVARLKHRDEWAKKAQRLMEMML